MRKEMFTIQGELPDLNTIIKESKRDGYWLAKSEKEYIRFRKEYISRAVKIFETVSKMDMTTEGQIGGLEN